MQELQAADLGHGGLGGGHGEAVALVLALMAEKCAGEVSRCFVLRRSQPSCDITHRPSVAKSGKPWSSAAADTVASLETLHCCQHC